MEAGRRELCRIEGPMRPPRFGELQEVRAILRLALRRRNWRRPEALDFFVRGIADEVLRNGVGHGDGIAGLRGVDLNPYDVWAVRLSRDVPTRWS
jgi:hypothetical protein